MRASESDREREKVRVGERAVKPEKHNKKFMSFTRNAKLKQKVQIMNDKRTDGRTKGDGRKRGATREEKVRCRLKTGDDRQK